MNQLVASLLNRPLRNVMLIAVALRLLAVFTAPGYLMHDDHFLVVEAAASWADGEDYDDWLPWNQKGEKVVHPANFAYVGTQYVVFEALNALGIEDPQVKMLVVRFLHGLYSLLIVFFAFKITQKLSNDRNALLVGLFLAAAAIMPNFSVRQLVEFICIPPLLWATWVLVKHQDHLRWQHFVWAGLGIGLATGFRFQCGMFGIGFGLALLFKRQFLGAILLGMVSLLTFAIAQIQDYFIWGEPFTQLRAYISYNDTHAGNYPNGPWYMYLLTLAGFLVPPVSVFLMFGFFASVRKHLIVALPALVFLVFHSVFPNKQERFIFPVIPYIAILGVIGWSGWMVKSTFWQARTKLWRGLVLVFLVLNTAGLLVLTFTYGKRSRVESMSYLYAQGDLENFMTVFLESSSMPPLFYTGSWEANYWFQPGQTKADVQHSDICRMADRRTIPNYILFYGDRGLDEHVALFDAEWGGIAYATTIEPGFLDRVLHRLNPNNNKLETVHIYRASQQRICP
jgi:hypothetical protein